MEMISLTQMVRDKEFMLLEFVTLESDIGLKMCGKFNLCVGNCFELYIASNN